MSAGGNTSWPTMLIGCRNSFRARAYQAMGPSLSSYGVVVGLIDWLI